MLKLADLLVQTKPVCYGLVQFKLSSVVFRLVKRTVLNCASMVFTASVDTIIDKSLNFNVVLIQLSFHTSLFTQCMQKYFQSKYSNIQSNCAEGVHFSAFFHCYRYYYSPSEQNLKNLLLQQCGHIPCSHYL